MKLVWHLDYEINSVQLELHYRVKKSEYKWIAIGFSDRGEINNADLCFACIDKDGKENYQVFFLYYLN